MAEGGPWSFLAALFCFLSSLSADLRECLFPNGTERNWCFVGPALLMRPCLRTHPITTAGPFLSSGADTANRFIHRDPRGEGKPAGAIKGAAILCRRRRGLLEAEGSWSRTGDARRLTLLPNERKTPCPAWAVRPVPPTNTPNQGRPVPSVHWLKPRSQRPPATAAAELPSARPSRRTCISPRQFTSHAPTFPVAASHGERRAAPSLRKQEGGPPLAMTLKLPVGNLPDGQVLTPHCRPSTHSQPTAPAPWYRLCMCASLRKLAPKGRLPRPDILHPAESQTGSCIPPYPFSLSHPPRIALAVALDVFPLPGTRHQAVEARCTALPGRGRIPGPSLPARDARCQIRSPEDTRQRASASEHDVTSPRNV